MTAAVARARLLLADAIAVLDLRECDSGGIPLLDIVGAARSAGVRLAAVLVPGSVEQALLADVDLPIIEAPSATGGRAMKQKAGEEYNPDEAGQAGSSRKTDEARGAVEAQKAGAAQEATEGSTRDGLGQAGGAQEGAEWHMAGESTQASSTPPKEIGPPAPLCVTQPVRSGQRLYAQGRDLLVLAPTSRGAELIADGSIYAFVPLRGRALAGASGDKGACIIATALDAELVAVAGVYRTLEAADLGGFGDSAVSVTLAFDAEGSERLVLRSVGSLPSFS